MSELYDGWEGRHNRFIAERIRQTAIKDQLPITMLAERYGVKPNTVQQILSRAGIKVPTLGEWVP